MEAVKQVMLEAEEILATDGNNACLSYLHTKGIPLNIALGYLDQLRNEKNRRVYQQMNGS